MESISYSDGLPYGQSAQMSNIYDDYSPDDDDYSAVDDYSVVDDYDDYNQDISSDASASYGSIDDDYSEVDSFDSAE